MYLKAFWRTIQIIDYTGFRADSRKWIGQNQIPISLMYMQRGTTNSIFYTMFERSSTVYQDCEIVAG